MSTATFSPTFDIETRYASVRQVVCVGLTSGDWYEVARWGDDIRVCRDRFRNHECLDVLPLDAPLVSILWAIYEDVMGDEA